MKPESIEKLRAEIQQLKKDQERMLVQLNIIEQLLTRGVSDSSVQDKPLEHKQPTPSPQHSDHASHIQPSTTEEQVQPKSEVEVSTTQSERTVQPDPLPDGEVARHAQSSAAEKVGIHDQVPHSEVKQSQPYKKGPQHQPQPQQFQQRQQAQKSPQPKFAKLSEPVQPEKSKNKHSLEQIIGGTWLNRIGVVAVLIGLALFLKYSFDNEWIGPLGRVLLGVLAGLVLLGIGEKLRGRFPGYAQSLLGGGSLALFFSVYASYSFYGFISPPFAFIFLVLVMTNTVFMAVRHNSLAIGILGIIGGYSTPFLIDNVGTSLSLLFSYLMVLTFGVLGVSIYKKWTTFKYLSFVFNQIIFMIVWVEAIFAGFPEVGSMLWFVLALYVTYLGIATVYNLRKRQSSSLWDIGLIIVNPFMMLIWSLNLFEKTMITDYKGIFVLLLAIGYFYLGRLSNRFLPADKRQRYTFFSIAFVLVNLAIPLQFGGSIGILFSFLAMSTFLLLSLALYRKSDLFLYLSAYLSLVFNHFIFFIVWASSFLDETISIGTMFSFITVLFLEYVILVTVFRIRRKQMTSGWDIGFVITNASLFFLWSISLLNDTFMAEYTGLWTALIAAVYVGLGVMCHRLLPNDQTGQNTFSGIALALITIAIPLQFEVEMTAIGWLVEAALLLALTKKSHRLYFATTGLIVLLGGLSITLYQLAMLSFEPTFLFNLPTLIWISSLLALIGCGIWLSEVRGFPHARSFVITLRAILLFDIFLGIWLQNHHYFSLNVIDGFLSPEQLTLSALWIVYAVVLFAIGVRKRVRYMRYVSIGLLAVVIVKAFLIDLASLDAIFKIVLFVLLGVCLLIISFIYQKKKDALK